MPSVPVTTATTLYPSPVATNVRWLCNSTICDKSNYIHTLYGAIDVSTLDKQENMDKLFGDLTKFCIYTKDSTVYVAHFPTEEYDVATITLAVTKKNKSFEYRVDRLGDYSRSINPEKVISDAQLEAYGRWKDHELGRLYYGIRLDGTTFISYVVYAQYEKLWLDADVNLFMRRFGITPHFKPCV